MISLEDELDVTNTKISQLEASICILQDNVVTLSENMKEMQKYLIMLAKNQSEVTKRISQWPYIAVAYREGDDV